MNTRSHRFWRYAFIFSILVIAAAAPSFPAMQNTADEKLEKAREDLRLSLDTQKRIVENIETLKRSGNASPEILKEYETYLKNVALMVEENRRIVKSMEAAYLRRTGTDADAARNTASNAPELFIPEEKEVDTLTALDRELNASLAAFDEMLLKELELIQAKSAEKMRDFAVEAAEAAKRLKEKEEARGESREGGAREASGESNKGKDREPYDASGREEDASSETDGHRQDRARPGKKREPRRTAEPETSVGAQDDDIVARQLREAAENETDPELREKLWKKYEEYKNSTQN